MRAEILIENDITIVKLQGRLDFETTEPFRRECLQKLLDQRVVFDLRELSFVGSSGISSFVDVLVEFAKRNNIPPKFSQVPSEFKRIFAASPLARLQYFDESKQALYSFINNTVGPSLEFLENETITEGFITEEEA